MSNLFGSSNSDVRLQPYDRYSGNDRFSGTKTPDRFFNYNGRCLYLKLFLNSVTEGFWRCCYEIQMNCCPSVHQRDNAMKWKNTICWILEYNIRLAGNQNTVM